MTTTRPCTQCENWIATWIGRAACCGETVILLCPACRNTTLRNTTPYACRRCGHHTPTQKAYQWEQL